MRTLKIDTPRAFLPLLSPARYKGAYGGRSTGKSYFFADMLIEKCLMYPTRWACVREVQNSLKESVQQLLMDRAEHHGVSKYFSPVEGEIRGPNKSLLLMKGMHHYNAESIKSLQDFDGMWGEEAQTLAKKSLRILRPTFRKKNSELWFSWNPRHDEDAVDEFLRGPNRPLPDAPDFEKRAIVVKVSCLDNPWFPAASIADMELDYATDPDMAAHVWGGGYEIISEGAYYAKLLAKAESGGRVGNFPYDPRYPVDTAWDIGVDDYNAVWLLQNDGVKCWAIGYDETSGEGPEVIIQRALPSGYRYGIHYFPHDIRNREWGAGAKSRLEIVRGLGLKNINVGTTEGGMNGAAKRIAAVRQLLPILAFDDKATATGRKRLRNYKRKFNETAKVFGGPNHDEASHGSDALGEYAINCQILPKQPKVAAADPPDQDQWRGGEREEVGWNVA